MLYLAQVQKKGFLGKTGLRLLAYRKSAYTWRLVGEFEDIVANEASGWSEGVLLLVELSRDRQVRSVEEATGWILETIDRCLSQGIGPEAIERELEGVENWRHSLTLQSQELSRQRVELEARRDQLQELEEKLKAEQRRLEAIAKQLRSQMDS
jgi:hypothetical protein